jgi:hypothetical protein
MLIETLLMFTLASHGFEDSLSISTKPRQQPDKQPDTSVTRPPNGLTFSRKPRKQTVTVRATDAQFVGGYVLDRDAGGDPSDREGQIPAKLGRHAE